MICTSLCQRITVDRDGHVVLIGVNRPAKRNAFGLSMLEECCRPRMTVWVAERELLAAVSSRPRRSFLSRPRPDRGRGRPSPNVGRRYLPAQAATTRSGSGVNRFSSRW